MNMLECKLPGAKGALHAEYAGMQECLVQRGSNAYSIYAGKEEYLVQREQCMLNTSECRNTSCRGSNAC